MGQPNKKALWQKNLYNDLREVFGLYDLEIVVDDGMWLRVSPYADSFELEVKPFSAHVPWEKDGRGSARVGATEWAGNKAKGFEADGIMPYAHACLADDCSCKEGS